MKYTRVSPGFRWGSNHSTIGRISNGVYQSTQDRGEYLAQGSPNRHTVRLLHCAAGITGDNPWLFVTDTLGDPNVEQEWLPNTYAPIAESRRQGQAALLDRICSGPLISVTQLKEAAALELPAVRKRKKPSQGRSLLDGLE